MSTKNKMWAVIQKAAECQQAPTDAQRIAKAITPEMYDAYNAAVADAPSVEVATAPDAFDSIARIAKVVREQTGCTPELAAAAVLEQNPELYTDYLAKQQHASEPTPERVRKMAGVRSSRAAIRQHVREDVLKRLRANGFDV